MNKKRNWDELFAEAEAAVRQPTSIGPDGRFHPVNHACLPLPLVKQTDGRGLRSPQTAVFGLPPMLSAWLRRQGKHGETRVLAACAGLSRTVAEWAVT
jgi:hypothetical protein